MIKNKLELLNSLLDKWSEPENADTSAVHILEIAEDIIKHNIIHENKNEIWHKYLNITRLSSFLKQLPGTTERYRWAETAFTAIRESDYNLKILFSQRVDSHPDRILFKVTEGEKILNFSYKWMERRIRQFAGLFCMLSENPRVAIFSDNNLEAATADLACLIYGIFDSPLNIHFGKEVLSDIFNKIKINIVITDSAQRLNLIQKIKEESNQEFKIIYTGYEKIPSADNFIILEQAIALLDPQKIDETLADKPSVNLDDTATIMFTSGSTGHAKGVCFSYYNLISKRFARAAALPNVGENELLLCYLPLYHTFGRFLELMGMLFWGGTYVFTDNPSIETLIKLMQKLNPTGLISIPLRWVQIRDKFFESTTKSINHITFRKLVGKNLRWGLSAAGYLEPKVFSFFHNHNVELCSGFGMTEATGGITMTPPGEYITNSVGIPLPGIKARFTESGELEISGPYVARYLDSNISFKDDYWLPTGDLFKTDNNNHFYIIDRIKDIYKNVKGQTIAPRKIEKLFEGVPGIKRSFLVGDGMSYNTLLIVPDLNDPVLPKAETKKKIREYFQPIVSSANKDLAPYERIIDFTVLERDFEESKHELTLKGTFRRKNIEENFRSEINRMYSYSNLEYKIGEITVIIPRWVFRDLSITEYEIKSQSDGMYNKLTNTFLPIKKNYRNDRIQVGDFEYIISNEHVNLGIFIRQPLLWTGNISLINFAYCKDGWDSEFEGISSQIFLTVEHSVNMSDSLFQRILNSKLKEINKLIVETLFGRNENAVTSLKHLERLLHTETYRVSELIRRRLESLALHPDLEVRSIAYRILLFDEPQIDYSKYLPAFINSGLPFLDKHSIEEMSKYNIEPSRLKAFRQRLESYRKTINWPASSVTILQFKRILELLLNFAQHNRFYYGTLREELISWILLKEEPALSSYAKELFNKLSAWFESTFELTQFEKAEQNWKDRIVYQEDFSQEEIQKIEKVIICTTYLKEALFLIFEEDKFNLKFIPESGIWVSRIISPHNVFLYRFSINTTFGKHYDMMLLLKDDISKSTIRETIYWMIKIAGSPGKNAVFPKYGNYRSPSGAVSLAFINELSVWEKIREYSCTRVSNPSYKNEFKWKLLFVRAFAAFFRAWRKSGYQIIPGLLLPTNVLVPDPDFKENAYLLSISGWEKYKNTLSLIKPIINNFYRQTIANYPWNKEVLKLEWIFDAIVEGLGEDNSIIFLEDLKKDLHVDPIEYNQINIKHEIDVFIYKLKSEPYQKLSFLSSVNRYNEWLEANPDSTPNAKDQFIKKLYWLYHLDRMPEIMRYLFYKKTYFTRQSRNGFQGPDKYKETGKCFDNLIKVMFEHPGEAATRLIELSELQESLKDPEDRQVFSKIVFPEISKPVQMEIMTVGEDEYKDVLVKTTIKDGNNNSYNIRKAISPFEVGSLYRMFILDDYPVNITSEDQFLVMTDDESQSSHDGINGGICYKITEPSVAHLEGIVVASPLRGRGVGGLLLEDFCSRMYAEGMKVVTTQYVLISFFEKYQFKVDSRWGGLVRFLTH